MGSSMKVHQLARGFWEQQELSLSLGCKRLRPLAPKISSTAITDNNNNNNNTISSSSSSSVSSSFHIKSFIRPECGPTKLASSDRTKKDSPQEETPVPGGTRWNPTQEQIGILEMLYKGGMRTPNAQQIEQITAQLGRYGKIEGKNVFYWFQNHKARERQKQKRNSLGLTHTPRTPPPAFTSIISLDTRREVEYQEDSPYKRKCRSWGYANSEFEEENKSCCSEEGDRTLELFPLHPEGR